MHQKLKMAQWQAITDSRELNNIYGLKQYVYIMITTTQISILHK